MTRPTMSSGDRLIACPSSFALASNPEPNEYSGAGTVRHDFLADLQDMPYAEALARVPEAHREECESLPVEHFPIGDGYRAEVALCYHAASDTAEELGQRLNRRYGELGPYDIPGTVDVLRVHDDHVEIWDYKGHDPHLPPARYAAQLRLCGLAAARAYGVDRVVVGFMRVHSGKRDMAELDAFDLMDIAEEVKAGLKAANVASVKVTRGEPVSTNPGSHCKYCPAKLSCPSMGGALALATREDWQQLAAPRLTTVDHVAEALMLKECMEAMAKLIGKSLEAAAREGMEVAGADGKVWGEHTKSGRESLDGTAVFNTVAELHGQVHAEACVEYKATKTALKKVLGNKAANDVIERVRKAGGVTGGGEYRAVGWYRPKQLRGAS